LGLLTEEQKRKVAVMKMDRKIQWLKVKIHDMEKMIELTFERFRK
jgi:predicted 2-oxoglutarate/Fe(II)-dependent dioxygenase YbiX